MLVHRHDPHVHHRFSVLLSALDRFAVAGEVCTSYRCSRNTLLALLFRKGNARMLDLLSYGLAELLLWIDHVWRDLLAGLWTQAEEIRP